MVTGTAETDEDRRVVAVPDDAANGIRGESNMQDDENAAGTGDEQADEQTRAEINAEMEHQTARDTTEGPEKPLGARGAKMADHVGAAA